MSWELVRLDDLCKMNSGGTPSRSNLSYYNGKIPWAKISDIENAEGGVIKYTEEHITNEGLASINNRIFPKGILLLAMYGSVGKVAFTGMEMATNQAILGIQIKDELILDYSYLKYWFQTIKEKLLNRAVGGILQNISLGIVKDLLIPLPPLATQKRIAEILDAADALKRKDQQLLKKYDELAQAIFIDMFGDPVKNEKGWEVKKLGEVCLKITDGEHLNPTTVSSGKPLIMAKDIMFDGVDFSDYKCVSEIDFIKFTKKCNPIYGDLILVSRGATIGRCCVVNTNRQFCLMGSTILIKASMDLSTEYLNQLFKIENFKNKLVNVSSASAQQAIYISNVKELSTPIPPLELQLKYSSYLKNIKLQLQICSNMKFDSETLFNSLIQKAFNGELVN